MAQGIGMLTASLQVRIRDTKQIIDLVLRGCIFPFGRIFRCGIKYTAEYLELFFLNPVAVYIEMARIAVLGVRFTHLESNQFSG